MRRILDAKMINIRSSTIILSGLVTEYCCTACVGDRLPGSVWMRDLKMVTYFDQIMLCAAYRVCKRTASVNLKLSRCAVR